MPHRISPNHAYFSSGEFFTWRPKSEALEIKRAAEAVLPSSAANDLAIASSAMDPTLNWVSREPSVGLTARTRLKKPRVGRCFEIIETLTIIIA